MWVQSNEFCTCKNAKKTTDITKPKELLFKRSIKNILNINSSIIGANIQDKKTLESIKKDLKKII